MPAINKIDSVRIGSDTSFLDFCIVYENAIIGDRVTIGEHCTIGKIPTPTSAMVQNKKFAPEDTIVGDDTCLCSGVTLYTGVKVGRECLIGDSASLFTNITVGDKVLISRGVTINAHVTIGSCTRIMDLTHITGHSTIGSNVFISVGVYTANDNFFNKYGITEKIKGITIGDKTSIGSGAILMPGVTIGKQCIVAAGSVVKESFGDGLLIAGNPAKALCRVPKTWIK